MGEKAPADRAWFRNPWVQALLTLLVFAVIGIVFAAVADRKDSAYWSGYVDAQRWVDDGGYTARKESVADFCRTKAAAQQGSRSYERGCIDGAGNAMRSPQ